jgi:L-asparaginase/Glu-tRNA(Gln) amidotransferase subunit D
MAIAVISTGGTISPIEEQGGDASPELDSDDLVTSMPGLTDVTDVVTDDFATIVSHHYTIKQMYGRWCRISIKA